MKETRQETIETPLGQKIQVKWYSATADEIENAISRGGCVRIKAGEKMYLVQFHPEMDHGHYIVLNPESDDVEPKEVESLREVFEGEVEFFHDVKV